ncbi:sugar transferase EpsL [Georgenia satyanarayanai]|uniref:Sugar transferase EpsL n=1 Tax=Georgenia satyanarayanai TaxID=860221 RepID=A0A2Y9ALC0_9MICO|nr:sugar transferase [Georgenia satyanarayanai]PYF98339.1 sugar transferase EpsL [Georgenia satyanarayanai]SSA45224.1 sugar transferase EpsL [Georgenia satyanarayanai]
MYKPNDHTTPPARTSSEKATTSGAKRLIDVVGAFTGLVATAPLTLPAAAAIRLTMGRPVLFRQLRPGLHGMPFTVMKFRTMVPSVDAEPTAAADESRLTPVGRFLRRTSIDEIPQLFNVLRGEMSLVGPRPLLLEYLDQYTPEQHRRHSVKPGITGLAQVAGRQNLAFSRRIALDLQYIDGWTLGLDLRILARTAKQLFRSDDTNPDTTRGPINDLRDSGTHKEGP